MRLSGRKILLSSAGQDATAKFNKYHPWVNAPMILKGALKGTICGPPKSGASTLSSPGRRMPSDSPNSAVVTLSLPTSTAETEGEDEGDEEVETNSEQTGFFRKLFFPFSTPSTKTTRTHKAGEQEEELGDEE